MTINVNGNSPHQYRGHVVAVNNGGFGFILAEDRNIESDVYFHTSDVVGGNYLEKNDRVSFRLTKTSKGYRARLIEREQRKDAQ